MSSTQGWSIDARRREIRRILAVLSAHGLSNGEANTLLANRLGAEQNTIEGWRGISRAPPSWTTLDLIRYELGLERACCRLPGIAVPKRRPPAVPSMQGRNDAARRREIQRVLTAPILSGLPETQVNELIGDRLGTRADTVRGWRGDTRKPPAWETIDVLRYEMGLAAVRTLLTPRRVPRAARAA